MDLRRLDDRVVPLLAARVQTARDTVAAAPRPGALLHELDEHYASTGVLRVVRDAPVLGVLIAVSVLLTGAGVGVAMAQGDAWRAAAQAAAGQRLGPPAGADVEASLAASAALAVDLAREAPGARALALVSLREQLDVERAARLVAGSQMVLRRAYVRAPVDAPAEVLAVEVGSDPGRTLRALLTETARRKAEQQRELTALAAGAGARPSYAEQARVAGQEAAAYRADCSCVLAVVVEGPASELAELLSVPTVRGVDVAPRGARLAELEVAPLPPEVSGSVPPAGTGR